MFGPNLDEDTICAQATPPGIGGVSIVRISGRESLASLRQLAPQFSSFPQSHTCRLASLKKLNGDELDSALITFFAAGSSYTGEETVEIAVHGNPLIVAETLEELTAVGCRMALPGEFTYRAFINGRIDLVQAESVLDLVHAKTRNARKAALSQLGGSLSTILEGIEDDLTWVLAQIEAGIDFSVEDISPAAQAEIQVRLERLCASLDGLVQSYSAGRLIRDGVKVVILGAPNVGKSSLFNCLVGEDRAIVSDVAGTTRDTVDTEILVSGQRIIFCDTAGLRETNDVVEKAGIERTRRAIEKADVGLFVVECTDLKRATEFSFGESAGRTILVLSKCDLLTAANFEELKIAANALVVSSKKFSAVAYVSSTAGTGIEALLNEVVGESQKQVVEGAAVFRARHFEEAQHMSEGVREAREMLAQGKGLEYVAVPLQEALRRNQELLGKTFDEQVLDRVFKEFCIGK
jgi:tRNA modification GTPase